MATIKDVAKLAGVSPSTVSRTLSGNAPVDKRTKERVLKAIKALNYKPNILAKGLKEGRTKALGLVLPNITNPIFPLVARGVEDIARKEGYTVILCNTDEDKDIEIDYINKLKNRWVDGFIFATAGKDAKHILDLKEDGFPVVLLIRNIENKVDSVIIDSFKAAYRATTYLLGLGRKRIALVNGDESLSLYSERLEGYKKALADNNISIEESLILYEIQDMEGAYKAVKGLYNSGTKPDAIIATCDPKAYGAARAIKELGLSIPKDVALMGFDNLEMSAFMDPPITTISQPWYEMGATAIRRLLQLIEGDGKKPKVDMFDVDIIRRESTKISKGEI
ncbi:MAG: LacI family transcriptional regulator [Clostridiales bacterium]|nr:LacI family transcriptional regulator [Clostridiales bacterium]